MRGSPATASFARPAAQDGGSLQTTARGLPPAGAAAGFTPLRDFRTLDGRGRTLETPRLALETRRAYQRREAALELAQLIGEEPTPFDLSASVTDDPVLVARSLRALLGVTLDVQFDWADQYVALNAWKSAAERAGGFVFQTENLPISEARGFSVALFPLPVVALNSKESPKGRIFTHMHELAHIALRASGVCDLHDDSKSKRESDRVEVFCNRVAGATLLPSESLDSTLVALELSDEREWLETSLRRLADRYSISTDAALRRCKPALPCRPLRESPRIRRRGTQASRSRAVLTSGARSVGRRFARMASPPMTPWISAPILRSSSVKIKQVEQIRKRSGRKISPRRRDDLLLRHQRLPTRGPGTTLRMFPQLWRAIEDEIVGGECSSRRCALVATKDDSVLAGEEATRAVRRLDDAQQGSRRSSLQFPKLIDTRPRAQTPL